jgi:hypothetical protein
VNALADALAETDPGAPLGEGSLFVGSGPF